MSQNTDVTGDSSAPNPDVTGDSSTQNSVNDDSQSQQNVPYERFKEVNDQLKDTKSEMQELRELVEGINKPSEPEVKSEIPDPYDDPESYAKYMEDRAYNRIKTEQQSEFSKKQELEKDISDQFNKIRESHKEINEDAIADFALEYNIKDDNGNFNLINAHKLMSSMSGAKEEGVSNAMKSLQRGSMIPSGNNSNAPTSLGDIGQKELKGMSIDNLSAWLSNRQK
jgi:hypothetical protein